MAATGKAKSERPQDDVRSLIRETYEKAVSGGHGLDPPMMGDGIKSPWVPPCEKIKIPFFKMPDGGEDFLEYAKSLFYLAAKREGLSDPHSYFTVYINMTRLMTYKQDKDYREELKKGGYETYLGDENAAEHFIANLMPGYATETEYEEANVDLPLMLTLLGIH